MGSVRALMPQIELTEASTEEITGVVSVPGVWLQPATLGGTQFVTMSIPEQGHTDVVGAPQLPVIRSLLSVPEDATITAEISGQPRWLSMAEAGITRSLAPLQASVSKAVDSPQSDALDFSLVYATDQFLPAEGIRITEAGYSAGRRLVMLEVAPIAYNPAMDVIGVCETLTFTVHFDGAKGDTASSLPLEQSATPQLISNNTADAATVADKRLLIVTHDDFEADLATFVAHKQSLGWTVDVADTTTAGTTNTSIRNYIKARYSNIATRPNAVLLVGDTDRIPAFTGLGDAHPQTDLYYGCMDGGDDWNPEVPVGRFSVQDSTQLAAVIAKTINYETAPAAPWMNDATFMASNDPVYYDLAEGTHNYVIDTYFAPRGYTSHKLYSQTYGAKTADICNAFNAGTNFGVYSGHGIATRWQDPVFDSSDVRALTNANKYPLIASFACSTGSYAAGESFMETWLREPDGGAVATVGASVPSYWGPDDILERRLFKAIYDENYTSYGSALAAQKELFLRSYTAADPNTRSYFEMYNLLGDPTVEIRRQQLTISSPAQLPAARHGQPYEYLLSATDGMMPYSWSLIAGSLPAGLQLDIATGRIYGTPTEHGDFNFTLRVQDSATPPGVDTRSFTLQVDEPLPVTVTLRHIFYNNSAFDGNESAADADDDLAIAPDKQALLPGQTAGFANYTSYARGINGIMVDIDGLADCRSSSVRLTFAFKVGNSNDPGRLGRCTAALVDHVAAGCGRRRLRPRDDLLGGQRDQEPVAAGHRSGPADTRAWRPTTCSTSATPSAKRATRPATRSSTPPTRSWPGISTTACSTRQRSTTRTTTTATGWSTGPIRSSPETIRRIR